MLKVDGLTRRYGDQTVVDNLSFTVNKGEFVALLGPSGCGKSTSLKMIAGLETPDAGSIELEGRDITHLTPGQRKLAMVFQSYALFPHLKVIDNILFGLQARKVAKDEQKRRLDSVVELVGLEDHLQKKPGQLSGGQCQRVALARAVVAEAELCLMDEPLSNLDAKLRNEMRTEIRSLQQRLGMSVIYVTHDQVEAMSMADRIVLMNDGKIEQIDVPEVLYNKPKSIFTAQFIGSPPMNIIHLENQCLGVRPEHVEISTDGLPASVISCDYHGADTIVLAELTTQESTVEKIRIRYPGHAMFNAQQSISVHWSSDHEHRFPVDQ
ncbi:MAG: sn-glycerol 3-phosphate transport system ATP-binding protein [Gammaproteobacteria bacterium]|jgi:sn-glycerol 3-phosphate transport system ATP-binding protein